VRTLSSILMLVSLPALAYATEAPDIRIRLAVAGDRGRNVVLIEGIPPSQAQPAAALLACAVQRSGAGFRCQERKVQDGLAFSGRFHFKEALALLGRSEAPVRCKVPVSPLAASAPAMRELVARPDTVLAWRTGFEWPSLAVSMAAIPVLLWCLFRCPGRHWA